MVGSWVPRIIVIGGQTAPPWAETCEGPGHSRRWPLLRTLVVAAGRGVHAGCRCRLRTAHWSRFVWKGPRQGRKSGQSGQLGQLGQLGEVWLERGAGKCMLDKRSKASSVCRARTTCVYLLPSSAALAASTDRGRCLGSLGRSGVRLGLPEGPPFPPSSAPSSPTGPGCQFLVPIYACTFARNWTG